MKELRETYIGFFVVSVLVFFLFQWQGFFVVRGFSESVGMPIQKVLRMSVPFAFGQVSDDSAIKMRVEIAQLKRENQALRDQFHTEEIKSMALIPATIVGAAQFIPGVTPLEELVVDKGKWDGVVVGQAVIYKNSLVGKVLKTSPRFTSVEVITNRKSRVSAGIVDTSIRGVLRGLGEGEMIFDNVLISEEIQVGSLVESVGDMTVGGIGIPRGLVVGKIVSVDKKPSALFQSARVKSLFSFAKLNTVFIQTEEK